MFNKLVASEGRKTKALSPTTLVVSILAHVGILGGAAYASEHTEVGKKMKEEVVQYMEVEQQKPPEPEPPKPEPPPPPPPEEKAPPPVAKGFQELVPPENPPPKIPDVDPNQKAVDVKDFTGVGVAGGTSKGVEGGTPQNMANKEEQPGGEAPIDVSLAEEKPKLTNAAEVQRLLQRLYPPLLRDAGITGQATIKFVVDAEGRVDPGTISVVSATHDAFGEASTKVGEKLKFKPAKVGGRPVPVLVTMPITWTLEKT